MPERPLLPERPPRIVAVSRDGSAIALRLAAAWPAATAFLPERFAPPAPGPQIRPTASPFGAIREGFARGEDLIVVAALGIVVRAIGPLLVDKRSDPAVVAVDDAGRFAIGVVSGHLGGGNALANHVADLIGARPVITTASEAHGLEPLDLLGQIEGWTLRATPEALRRVAAAAVNGDPIGVCQTAGTRRWRTRTGPPEGPVPIPFQDFATLETLARSSLPAVVVTERALPSDGPCTVAAEARWIVYHPPALAVGIGCSRGASAGEIAALVDSTLSAHGLTRAAIGFLATIDLKKDEAGLLQLAACWHLPLVFFTAEALARVGSPSPSEAVQAAVGTPGVCEPAARLAADGGPLIVPKQKSRNVTVAIARRAEDDNADDQ